MSSPTLFNLTLLLLGGAASPPNCCAAIFLMTDADQKKKIDEMESAAKERGEMIVVYIDHRENCLYDGKPNSCNCKCIFTEVIAK